MEKMYLWNRVLARLGFKVFAMAHKEGKIEEFIFYVLNREPHSHRPHVHVCVSADNKHYKGKFLESGENLKTIVSIYLRPDCKYTIDNLEFEEIYDPKSINSKNKKLWVQILNSKKPRSRNFNFSYDCLDDYFEDNDIIDRAADYDKTWLLK